MPATRVLTGITTSGTPHLGNYAGAIRPAIAASRRPGVESFYFLADYHALIKSHDPARVQRSTLEIAASWLACGLAPDKVWFYRQSDIPEIPELTWLLTCVAGKGLLNRAHAYKAAVDKNREAGEDDDAGITAGLFMYPVLMAADILLFKAHSVPVGRDQIQHIEMARDFGARFNHLYGEHFVLPEAAIEENARAIRQKLNLSCVVIHPRRGAAAAMEDRSGTFAGPFVQQPKISTGAGDHFNAGFCLGQVIGCSLEESCPPDELAEFLNEHADKNYYVIAYINCSAGVKALSDVICTSGNAVKIVQRAPADRNILFVPDANLGAWVIEQTGRPMELWQGACYVHVEFTRDSILKIRSEFPDAPVVAHPEASAPPVTAPAVPSCPWRGPCASVRLRPRRSRRRSCRG